VTTHESTSAPADAICEIAVQVKADLIVVGNKGMTGMRRVLGSVPNAVAHQAPCAVLIAFTS
jgi:nucleotide-binding universal stress UspA family protein